MKFQKSLSIGIVSLVLLWASYGVSAKEVDSTDVNQTYELTILKDGKEITKTEGVLLDGKFVLNESSPLEYTKSLTAVTTDGSSNHDLNKMTGIVDIGSSLILKSHKDNNNIIDVTYTETSLYGKTTGNFGPQYNNESYNLVNVMVSNTQNRVTLEKNQQIELNLNSKSKDLKLLIKRI